MKNKKCSNSKKVCYVCGYDAEDLVKQIVELEEENRQFKQQIHDLPKKIVEEIKANNIYLNSSKPNQKDHIYDSYLIEAKTLNAVLEKYGGEDE